MKKQKIEAPQWFFMWTTGKPYITACVGWTRRAVIREASFSQGIPWKTVYARGGRAVRCTVKPINAQFAALDRQSEGK